MSNGKSPIDEFLLSAQLMIENSLSDAEVKTALAVYGYTDEKLNAGKTLYDDALALQITQQKEYGDQVAATAELNDVWEIAYLQYMKTLKIARVAFQENVQANKAALLYGSRKRSLSGWLLQAREFYKNIMEDGFLVSAFTGFGYSRAKLSEEAALLEQVAAKYDKQNKEIGEAQMATQARDKKIDELARWVSDLRAVAKVALADDAQQLEKLGILARTSPANRSKKPAELGQSIETK